MSEETDRPAYHTKATKGGQKANDETNAKAKFPRLERGEWWFWIKWVLVSSLGEGVYQFVPCVAGQALSLMGEEVTALLAVLGLRLVGALVFATAQWLVLRKRVYRSGWWVLAGAVGFVVGSGVDSLLCTARWVTSAIAQWLVLRKRVYRSGWWVLAGAVGGLAGGLVTMLVVFVPVSDFVYKLVHSYVVWQCADFAVSGVVGGLVAGAITGFALIMLLRHPIPETKDDVRHEHRSQMGHPEAN
jgi:hypothetical protein